jgi:hypothetical protein
LPLRQRGFFFIARPNPCRSWGDSRRAGSSAIRKAFAAPCQMWLLPEECEDRLPPIAESLPQSRTREWRFIRWRRRTRLFQTLKRRAGEIRIVSWRSLSQRSRPGDLLGVLSSCGGPVGAVPVCDAPRHMPSTGHRLVAEAVPHQLFEALRSIREHVRIPAGTVPPA